jgi:hypothetical protein
MKLTDAAKATIQVLRDAGYEPVVEVKDHIKIRAPGLPMIICAKSPSDWRSKTSAKALARRIVRQAAAAGEPA